MPRVSAFRELLAPVEDVWEFLSEPHYLADWWPGLGAVEPDRRGFAAGARWQVRGSPRPSLLRRAAAPGLVVIQAVEPRRRLAFSVTGDRLDVELTLEPVGVDRTRARLDVRGPWLVGLSRSLPRQALSRLHALCQTAAEE